MSCRFSLGSGLAAGFDAGLAELGERIGVPSLEDAISCWPPIARQIALGAEEDLAVVDGVSPGGSYL